MYLFCNLSECIVLFFSCISSLLLLFFWRPLLFILQYKNKNPHIHVRKRRPKMKFHTSPTANTRWINPYHILMRLPKAVVVLIVVCACINTKLKIHNKCERKFVLMHAIKARLYTFLISVLDGSKLPSSASAHQRKRPGNHRITRCVEPRNSLSALEREAFANARNQDTIPRSSNTEQSRHIDYHTQNPAQKINCKTTYTQAPTGSLK